MTPSRTALPTLHARVERWECDYNDHWNVRFYGRSFQMASETVASLSGGANPGAATILSRQMRFHNELRVSAPVEVRSAVLTGAGTLDGAIVHELWSADTLAATAIDLPGTGGVHLPHVTPEQVPLAMPRSIHGPGSMAPAGADLPEIALGPIRPEDLDHTGQLRFEALLRHGSSSQHILLNRLGLTPAFAESHRINRMGVEMRVTRGGTPAPGTCLRGRSWISAIRGKAFWATAVIDAPGVGLVAEVEMCVVTVDLTTRKAVAVPDFMYAALGG